MGLRVSGFRVLGFRFRVEGFGFRVWDNGKENGNYYLGFRV